MNHPASPALWSPLSFAQRSRWLAYQIDPQYRGTHNNGFSARVDGRLDKHALALALARLVARHPMLRIQIRERGGEPEQWVRGHAPVQVSEVQGQDALAAQVRADFAVPFNLAETAALRATLYRRGPDVCILAIAFDHIAVDGWSYWQLLDELGALLAGRGADQPHTTGYLDYIDWQQAWLDGPASQVQQRYWDAQLRGPLPLLALPTDRRHANAGVREQRSVSITLDEASTGSLRSLARSQSTPLYVALMSAYFILLHRHGGQEDLIVGAPLPGRTQAQWDQVVGDFVNPVAVRVQLPGTLTVAQAMRAVRRAALGAMAHQELPFSRVVEHVQPARLENVHPVFQTTFTLQKARHGHSLASLFGDNQAVAWGGVTLTPFASHQTGGNQLALALEAIELEHGIRCDFKYDAALFDEATVLRMSGHFARIVQAAADQEIGAIDLLGQQERALVLGGLYPPRRDFGDTGLMHHLFERHAAQAPERIALVAGDTALSYGGLNRRANRIAHRLLALRLAPDARVAILAERDGDMVAGILGILKAGAAYVPLDAAYPAERLAYVLADCAPSAVLAQAALENCACPVLLLGDPDENAQRDDNPVLPSLSPSALAYIIYTSGSTGQPKGVMVEHRNVTRLLAATDAWFRFGADDAWTVFHSFAFDFSVWEMWGPLSTGGKMVLVPSLCARAPDEFYRLLCRERVTVLNQTPSAFAQLISAQARSPAHHSLRWIVLGGEALELRVLAPWFARNATRVANMYGITETTVHVSYREVTPADLAANTGSVIGVPVEDLSLRILDERLAPVPIGVTGEMFVGGAGLARGYFNRPALTAERFIADPFEPGARLYKTGDLARWRAHGDIEYLGRNDAQVKIRGYRIELGEIEAQLLACPGVREAAVLAQGGVRLVAYLVADVPVAPLREALARALPAYMLPEAFVQVDAFPLTPNGKLDRAALPQAGLETRAHAVFAAPQGPGEAAMAALWQQLLDVPQVGRHDHFFEIGGHSLLATRLLSRIGQRFDGAMSLGDLFANPTLEQMARLAGAPMAPIDPFERDPVRDVSLGQQRLWFLAQFDPAASRAYAMPGAWMVHGPLDKAVLRAALDAIVARHEILRTHFVEIGGVPQAVVAPVRPFPLREHNLSAAAGIGAYCAAETAQGFDLAAGPLMRGALLVLDPTTHVLLLTQHHIVSDGWSVRLLFAELASLYQAGIEGRADPLPPMALQYADFAQWQRGQPMQEQAAYWKRQLADAPLALQLPLDYPRPAQQDYAGGYVEALLAPQQVQAFAKRHGLTPFMVLAAAWAALLARMSGQDDVVIGTPSANRRHTEWETLIGFFVNTLPLRVSLADDPTVAALLAQVKATILAAQMHQDLPFDAIVEAVNPARSTAHSPIFQVMLAMDNTPGPDRAALPGLVLEPIAPAYQTSQFDLALSASMRPEGMHLELRYASALFERSTMQRLLRHFDHLLNAMMAQDDVPVSRLPLLDASDIATLARFNATAMPWPRESLLHHAFEAQAAAQPDQMALTWHAGQMSYGDLNRRANQIAHRLLQLGVRPDERVALCLERTPDMVAAVLGILKAGAAYVPLDPAYPRERLDYMLGDCAPVALLCQKSTLGSSAIPVVVLDADEQLAAQPVHDPLNDALPANLAYLIYTSGSTGQPKGVMIEHRNAVAFIAWAKATFPVAQLELPLFSTSLNFDLAVFELFLPLSTGRPLALVQNVLCSNDELSGVTLINTVPSAIDAMLKASWVPPSAMLVNLAGEALKRSLVERLFRETGVQVVGNLYGPSETTTYSTYVLMPREGGFVPHIGRPVGNTQVHILDRHGEPVPIGVLGEIYIGGAGVARGYLNRPELTAERFSADRFSADPQARLYRTGDLGRWLADGNIEYAGRTDFQVKIRGFRIELGEIETRLAACAGVQGALVLAAPDAKGDLRLAAYVVAPPGAVEPALLRTALAAQLPAHMVPKVFVLLDAWPLTPNGKLDRAALPAPDAPAPSDAALPLTGVEADLAAIWQDLLGLERIGRHDNFFEIGGHSLLAVQLIARMRRHLQVQVALADVFARPTLASLAEVAVPDACLPIPVLEPAPGYPVTHTQHQLWLAQRLDPRSTAYSIPVMLALPATADAPAVAGMLDLLIARHAALRTVFTLRGATLQQVILPALTLPLDQTEAAGETELERLIAQNARAIFDLEQGPLLRAQLVRTWDGRNLLLFNAHHLIADGVSLDILRREMLALLSGEPIALAPLPIGFADFAAWSNAAAGESGRYWREQLGGDLAHAELPYDFPPAQRTGMAGAACRLRMDPAQAQALHALAARQHATLFMVLATGLAMLLARMGERGEVLIGVPVAGRVHPDTQELVGCFINTILLRCKISGDDTVGSLLGKVRESTLQGLAHQTYPVQNLLDELGLERAALAPVALNLLPLASSEAALHRQLEHDVKFDLNLYVSEDAQGLAFDCHYRSSCFKPETVQYVLAAYLDLLAAMSQSGDRACASFEMFALAAPQGPVPELIAQRAYRRFEDGAIAQSIPQRFAQQVSLHGDRVAVRTAACSLTYRELDAASDRTGRLLMGCDGRVALLFGHGVTMLSSLLGALKAGKTYVPLDPAYPEQRLAYMLANSQAGIVLTDRAHLDLARRLGGACTVIDIDEPHDCSAALPSQIDPDTPAYILYTSGSTGQPKGVAQSHRNALYFCKSYTNQLHIGADDRLLLLASFSFDAALMDIFGALMNGAALYPADPKHTARADLLAWMAQESITIYHSTPTLYRHLFGVPGKIACESLRLIVLGGELVTPEDVACFQAKLGEQCVLVNGYGPTESTIALQNFITHRRAIAGAGYPVAGTSIALGEPGRPARVFQRGEIIIQSAHVALGYWNNAAQTARAFGTTPGGGRYYRTGDIGRYCMDGSLVVEGRIDRQVKIRGFRVEPGEIESALKRCDGVHDAIVLARAPGRLVAYLRAAAIDLPALRAQLLSVLPDYMIPGAYVLMEQFPHTPSGKIDHAALPAPDADAGVYEAAQGATEDLLARLWAELLGLERVGRYDHFFELGGDSLLAIALVDRLGQKRLAVRDVFVRPVLADLASVVAQAAGDDDPEKLPLSGLDPEALARLARSVGDVQDVYRLAPLQEGILFHHRLQGQGDAYVLQTVLRFADRAMLDRFLAALQKVIDRHDMLRTSVHWEDLPHAVQVVQATAVLPVRELTLPGQDMRAALIQATDPAHARLDIRVAPMLSATIGHDAGAWLVALMSNHLVCDHETLAVIMREVRQLMQDPAAQLPAAVPYRRFIAALAHEDPALHERFFRARLGDVSRPTAPFGVMEVHAGGMAVTESRRAIGGGLALRVRTAARRHQVSPAALCHLAWAVVAGRACQQDDVVFGTVLQGRMREGRQTVGMFINALPLRVTLAGTVAQALQAVHAELIDLLDHEQAPLSLALRCSPVAPLFTTLFNYRQSSKQALDFEVVHAQERTSYPVTVSVDDYHDVFGLKLLAVEGIDGALLAQAMEGALDALARSLEGEMATPLAALEIPDAAQLAALVRAAPRAPLARAPFAPPRSASEQTLAQLWSELLGVAQVGRDAHFFELGGDSLVALTLVERLRQRGLHVLVRDVFVRPVLADLAAAAAALDGADPAAQDASEVPPDAGRLTPEMVPLAGLDQHALDRLAVQLGGVAGVADVYRLAPLQEGILFHHRAQEQGDAYLLHTVLAFDGRTLLDAFIGALQRVIDRHPVLRTSVHWDDLPHPVQVVHSSVRLPVFEGALPDPGTARLDVRCAPLLSATISQDGAGQWLLALLSHHLVSDRLTLDVILEEVSALMNDVDAPLPSVVPYRRFIASLVGDGLDAHAAYFRARLEDVTSPSAPFGVLDVHAGAAQPAEARLALGLAASAGLRALARRHQASPAALCHLAWAIVAGRCLERGDVVIGTVLQGRMRGLAEGQRMAGMFINSLPLRVSLQGTVVQALQAVHADLAELLDHEQAPLSLALRCSGVAPPLPLFTTLFNYRQGGAARQGLSGVRVLHTQARTSYPVTVNVDELPDGFALQVLATGGIDAGLLARGLRGALVALAETPEMTVSGLELFDAADQACLSAAAGVEQVAAPRRQEPYAAPQGAIEQAMATLWCELLGVPQVSRHDHFFALGGDSLVVVVLAERLRRLGIGMPVREIFARPVLAGMAAAAVAVAAPGEDVALVPLHAARLTPAMVPLAGLDQDQLDRLGSADNVQDVYRLAPLQEGILFHHQAQAEGDAYLLHIVLECGDRPMLDGFLAALQQVIDRHDVLRTSVHWEGLPHPVQRVVRHARLNVSEIQLPAEESCAALVHATDPARVRLDVRRAPLLSATAGQDGSGKWLLALLCHHLVCDHVTLELIMDEVQALMKNPAALLPAAVPYRRFIAMQAGDDAEVHAAYFRSRLASVSIPTAPFDVLEVRAGGGQVSESRVVLAADLGIRLRTMARAHQVSPAAVCHLAWAAVLARFCGQDDVVFGTVLLGRMQGLAEGQRMAGMFINALPLRVRLEGTVAQALQAVHQELVALLQHEQAPLPLALRCSGVSAPLPLFTTLLNYRHSGTAHLDGLRVLHSRERSNYPVTVAVDDFHDGFALRVLAVEGIDGGALVHGLEGALAALVGSAADLPIGPLELFDAARLAVLTESVNETRRPFDQNVLMHELFERQVLAQPQASALSLGAQHLSYAELNRRANLVAHRLHALGVVPGTRVALCDTRGFDMVAGLLGILKAGGAYVPLDPAYPAARMRYMLDDSQPAVVLCGAALRARFEGSAPVLVLAELIGDGADPGNLCARSLGLHAGHLAYLIYTSGSTGQPKGVMIEHRPAINLIAWVNRRFAVGSADKLLFTTSICFDLSVYDIFGMLAAGALVRIALEDELADPERLLAILADEAITFWDSAPAAFSQMRPALARLGAVSASLRLAFFSGDWIAVDLPAVVTRAFPRCEVISLGGATEATIWSNFHPVTRVDPAWTSIPYGKPIDNARYYVLDQHLRPCPVHVAGDLYIGGDCLSAGYWNKPDLSAERFVPDPFAGALARMYRTGDRARYWADGNLEFLGRLDGQVKVRGYRIELGEIEACLSALEGVREAVVLASPDGQGGKRLVAYVVGAGPLAPAGLRAALAATLPEYMVPSAYVQLERLPLTANGKVDRAALPAPDGGALVTRAYQAPEGQNEQTLAALWSELLGVAEVGRQDHFFELGGHSLLVVTLVERLRQRGLAVQVIDVFNSPVLADLAALTGAPAPELADADGASWRDGLDEVQLAQLGASVPGGLDNVEDAYPLAPLQEAMLVHHLMGQGADAYLMRIMLEVDSSSQAKAFLAALQGVIDQQPVLRTTVRWRQPGEPLQLVLRRAALPASWLDTLEALEHASDPRHSAMPLDAAPLLRAFAVQLAGGRCRVALVYHHFICDHVTLDILMGQIAALLKDRSAVLPKSRAFRHYVLHWRAQPTDGHRAYFTKQLADVHTPTACAGLSDTGGSGAAIAEVYLPVPPDLAGRVERLARQFGTSPAVLFHLAWAKVLTRLCQRDDVVFGTVLSGRLQGQSGSDSALGVFINALPLRVRFEAFSAAELVAALRQGLPELIAHEQASYALAQQCSGIPASLPLFTALLNYRHGAPAQGGYEGIRLIDGYTRTNFPLSLDVDEYAGQFGIGIECSAPLDPQRVAAYVLGALTCLADALDAGSARAFVQLPMLDAPTASQIEMAWAAAQNTQRSFAIGPGDRVGVAHGLPDERAQRDVSAAQQAGAAILFAPALASPQSLYAWLEQNNVSVFSGEAAHVRLLGRVKASGAGLPALRRLIIGGGALLSRDVSRWRTLAPHARISHVVGVAATGFTGLCWHDDGQALPATFAPLGRPVAGVQIVLSAINGEPMFPDEPGLLHLRTDQGVFACGGWVVCDDSLLVTVAEETGDDHGAR